MEDSGVLCNRGRALFLTGNKRWRGLQDGEALHPSSSPNPSILTLLCCAVSDDSMIAPVTHTRFVG